MTSALSLDRILGELNTRRERILALTDPSGPRPDDLVEELNELAEQLLMADEELRVQQEELDSARGALLSLSAERDLLLEHSAKAYVITDQRGVVEQLPRATQQLIRQPHARTAPRPVASWFAVADRRTVRGMISRLVADPEPQRAAGVHLHLPDGGQVRVDVVAERVGTAVEGLPLLRWELITADDRLRTVREVTADERAAGAPPLVLELAGTALELQGCATQSDVVAVVLAAAHRLVAGAADARLVLGPEDITPADASSDGVGRGRPGRAAMTAPLVINGRQHGLLTVYAEDGEPLTTESQTTVAALATLAAVAVQQRNQADSLQQAITSGQRIGQAVGILIERRGITPETAFALLVSWSQNLNVKLRTLADTLVETGQEPPPRSRP